MSLYPHNAFGMQFTGGGGALTLLHAFGADSAGALKGVVSGTGLLTFARPVSRAVIDFESVSKTALVNELRVPLSRRVENINESALADWTANGGVSITDNGDGSITVSGYLSGSTSISNNNLVGVAVVGRRFVIAYDIKATNAVDAGKKVELRLQRISGGDGAAIVNESEADVTLTDEWQRFSTAGTYVTGNLGIKPLITGGIASGVVCPSIDVKAHVLEEVTGQTNQNPSERVLVGVDYGVGVNSVAYFDYENGNTVDGNNVVIEAKGSKLTTNWHALYDGSAGDDGVPSFDLSGNIDPTRGMLIVDWVPGFAYLSDPAGVRDLVSIQDALTGSILYNSATSGAIASTDGTNVAALTVNWDADKRYRVGVRWSGATLSMAHKNITDGGGWSAWSSAAFVGAYPSNSNINVGDTTTENGFASLLIFSTDEGEEWIESNY